MITVSYKDFISNSGNIQLDKIEDKLRNLFLVDSKIKLKEVDKIYTIDNINDFKDKTVGIVKNYSIKELLNNKYPNINKHHYISQIYKKM